MSSLKTVIHIRNRFRPLAGKWINELPIFLPNIANLKVSVPLRGSGLMNEGKTGFKIPELNVSVPLRGSGLMNLIQKQNGSNVPVVSVPLRGSGLMNVENYLTT